MCCRWRYILIQINMYVAECIVCHLPERVCSTNHRQAHYHTAQTRHEGIRIWGVLSRCGKWKRCLWMVKTINFQGVWLINMSAAGSDPIFTLLFAIMSGNTITVAPQNRYNKHYATIFTLISLHCTAYGLRNIKYVCKPSIHIIYINWVLIGTQVKSWVHKWILIVRDGFVV